MQTLVLTAKMNFYTSIAIEISDIYNKQGITLSCIVALLVNKDSVIFTYIYKYLILGKLSNQILKIQTDTTPSRLSVQQNKINFN